MDQLSMAGELARLIKDNLPCKHLILSAEETFLEFLAPSSSLEDILELEPMISYHRMLLHRLAEIFGLAHESVGEGDDRHLIVERCQDSSIPAILVSDILEWQYGETQSQQAACQLLKRKIALPGSRWQYNVVHQIHFLVGMVILTSWLDDKLSCKEDLETILEGRNLMHLMRNVWLI